MSAVIEGDVLKMRFGRPPAKLMPLYDTNIMKDIEYVILEGGRGGGKTECIGQKLIIDSMSDGGNVLCLREVQNSIEESVHKVLVDWIGKLGLGQHFIVMKKEIVNRQSGARFIFKGMKGSGDNASIKSIKGVKYIWYEEAQTLTKKSWDVLNPTFRIDGRRFYFTMNPDSEDDIVTSVIAKLKRSLVIHIDYLDNPYCPQVLIDQANECKELYPQDYEHIWLGKPRGDGDRNTVIPSAMLYECVDSHIDLGHTEGFTYGGLDLAAGETRKNDKNALSIVKGPVVLSSEEWRSADLGMLADRVVATMGSSNGARLFYDAVGVGGFAEKTLMSKNPTFGVIPYMGQHSVMGGENPFIRTGSQKISNADFFKNLKAQMWWNLRLRAENTLRMKRGFVSPRKEYYLSLSSNISNLDGLIREISQALWREDESGRVVINKTPGDYKVVVDGKNVTMRSPNRADSVVSAFLRSCKSGLRANR